MARRIRTVVGDSRPLPMSQFLMPTPHLLRRLRRVAQVYGRQTARASEIVRVIGYVAGGLPGQRLLARLSIATSDDTVLRRIRRAPEPTPNQLPVHNLGVDDWARRGRHPARK